MGTLRARRPDDVSSISRVALAEWQEQPCTSPEMGLGGARFPQTALFPADTPHSSRARIREGRTVTQQGPDLAASRAESRPAKERTAYYSAESRPGWLGARSPATRPGARCSGHAPCQIQGQSWVRFPGEGVFGFSPKMRKKRPKRAKTRQNGPSAAPALSFVTPHFVCTRARASLGEILALSRVRTISSASGMNTSRRLRHR